MNTQTFLTLLFPVVLSFHFRRGGRWHWADPVGPGGAAWLRTPFMHRLHVGMDHELGYCGAELVWTLARFTMSESPAMRPPCADPASVAVAIVK
jgi:hypothetical protein